MKMITAAALVAASAAAAPASAQNLSITVENLQGDGGFAFTPFWFGLHNGSFDVFESGTAASGGITEIAELGDTSVITNRFSMEQANGTQATFLEPNGPPVFSPGESATIDLSVANPGTYRYFNYASMVVPSNDLFVGNDTAIVLFDALGNFGGPVTIDIYGRDVYDNGSEVNDITDGPAFVAGVNGMLGTDENSVVRSFFTEAGDQSYIDSIIGTTTAPGPQVTTGFSADTLIARITIVPAPATAGLIGGAMVLVRRRR